MGTEHTSLEKVKHPNFRRRKELIFYSLMMIIPIIQVIIFYFIININSISLAFKSYSYGGDGALANYTFAGFENFKKCFIDLFNEYSLKSAFKNSMLAFALQTLLIPWIAMVFPNLFL